MSIKKDQAIQKIMKEFEEFSNLLLMQLDLLDKYITAVGTHEEADELLKKIYDCEEELDKFEIKISDRIINTIVLYNPMAVDLRMLMACYRNIINMERIGDLVVGVAKNLKQIVDGGLLKKSSDLIENMLLQSLKMVTKSLLSFSNSDKDFAIWTIKHDSVVDEMKYKMIKKLVKKQGFSDETQNLVMSYMNLKTIISDIERIGDHATNIAEATIFAVEGTDIRHNNDNQQIK